MTIRHIKIVSNNTTEFKFIFHEDKFRIKSLIIDPSVQNYSPVRQLQISEATFKLQKIICKILTSTFNDENLQKNIDRLRKNAVNLLNVVGSFDINLISGACLIFELNESIKTKDFNPELLNKVSFFTEVSSCEIKSESIYCREFMFNIN